MSADAQEDAGLSRKEKRAKRDAERAEKFRDKGGKKRKAVQDVDEVEDGMKENGDGGVKTIHEDGTVVGAAESTNTTTKNASKKRKTKHDAQEDDTQQKQDQDGTSKKRKVEPTEQAAPPSKKRFVVFIGNLPYSTTDTTLDAHFARLKPYTLRHRTDPKTKKSKGFAFIEFEDYDRLKTCLKIFHHSTFDPDNPGLNAEGDHSAAYGEDVNGFRGRKKRSHARKINVELTAGGGGSTEARKEKILAKNTRLDEQRKRRAEAERKEKLNKDRKRAKDDDKNKSSDTKESKQDAPGGIHPSRLARIAN